MASKKQVLHTTFSQVWAKRSEFSLQTGCISLTGKARSGQIAINGNIFPNSISINIQALPQPAQIEFQR